jgi:hypothetical protein
MYVWSYTGESVCVGDDEARLHTSTLQQQEQCSSRFDNERLKEHARAAIAPLTDATTCSSHAPILQQHQQQCIITSELC